MKKPDRMTMTVWSLVSADEGGPRHALYTDIKTAAQNWVAYVSSCTGDLMENPRDLLRQGNYARAIEQADAIAGQGGLHARARLARNELPVLTKAEQLERTVQEGPVRIDPYQVEAITDSIQKYFTDHIAVGVETGRPPEVESDRIRFVDNPESYIMPFGGEDGAVTHWRLFEKEPLNDCDPQVDAIVGRYDTPMEAILAGVTKHVMQAIEQEKEDGGMRI